MKMKSFIVGMVIAAALISLIALREYVYGWNRALRHSMYAVNHYTGYSFSEINNTLSIDSDKLWREVIMVQDGASSAEMIRKCEQLTQIDSRWTKNSVREADQVETVKKYLGLVEQVICDINGGSFDYIFYNYNESKKNKSDGHMQLALVDIETNMVVCYLYYA